MSWIEYNSFENYPSRELKTIPWECDVNEKILANNSIHNSWNKRLYMQFNAESIMNYNTKNSIYNLGNILNIRDIGYSCNTNIYSDLKHDYLKKEKKMACPSIKLN